MANILYEAIICVVKPAMLFMTDVVVFGGVFCSSDPLIMDIMPLFLSLFMSLILRSRQIYNTVQKPCPCI